MRPILSVKNLSVFSGKDALVSGISFDVHPKEILALIGPNGAGKTTILKAILGLVPYDGEVLVCGNAGSSRVKHIGYVPQRFVFDRRFPMLSEEFLKFAARGTDEEVEEVMDGIGISNLRGKKIGDLSGGEMQKVLLAKAILPRPCLILLDEATTGIDPEGVGEFSDLIKKIREEYSASIVFVSHEIDLVYKFADRVVGVNRSLVYEGAPDEALSAENLKRLYRGEVHLVGHAKHSHE